jgi:hypothetical protein
MSGTLDPAQSRFRCGNLVFIIPSRFGVVWSRVDMATSMTTRLKVHSVHTTRGNSRLLSPLDN